ncbi:hybrid sensor histidine kinase/response regulator [Streptosporangium sp. NBC_01756]|uniref:hybrid sensor histidine kinase/response regulator n=1 Tax=Streptosporangium sp. NBC_01756 TaxID=2975950 RepID=UPI002DD8D255|nr:response regulator [Streptosporangium sp. NBC_01756]WSC84736.1 response regulator [Streptosporangium sp. NBC_01756]
MTRLKGLFAVTALWILLGMLPLALLTSSSITLSEQAVRSEVRDRVETTASVSRVVVEQQMGSLKQLVGAFAQRPEVRQAVISGESAARLALSGYLKELAHMRGGISGVIVIGPDGDMIGAEPPSGLPQDVSTTDWYLAVRSRGQAHVSQAYTPTMRGVSRAVAVAAPIPAADGGEPPGILAAVYSLDAIQDFASQAAEAQGIRLLITDQSGVLVADPGRKVYALTSLREDRRVDAALAGRSLFTGFDGTVLSASEPIPDIGWTVTAEVPTAEALASAATLRMRVLSVAALLAVLIVAGLVVQIRTTRGRRRAQATLARYAEALAAARDEAVSASVAKTEFLAKVSHEIRTPINGVLGMNGLLLGTRMDDEQRHYAGTVQASAQNLLRLLDDFLDLSKIEAGRLEAEAVPFDLPRLCDEVVAPLAPQAYRQGLWLTLRLDDDVPQHVVGDPVRLRQVLSNLIGNALKFTVQGGVDLEVALEPAEGEGAAGDDHVTLRFAVTDTGVGVGPDDRSRVFEVFRQVDSPITRRTGGSGLGLAISRQLTELMGGRIGLDSMEGIGSRFHLTLPVDVLTWSAPASAALRGRRVLVADTRQEDRASAGRILAGAGLVAEQAQDATAALATLRAAADGHPFDLAVVDLDMSAVPEADEPVSLADAILSDPLLHATNVVVLVTPGRTGSAWPDVSVAPDRIVQSMTRPLSRRRLLAAVENTLPTADRDDESGMAEVASRSEPVRILVAEDDEVSREVARLVLRKAGHRVDVVGDGEQAVRAVLGGDYDLVFMDCQLPVLDGLAATVDIRRQERPGRTPIIAMTAAAMPDDRVRCLEAGMNAHLTKPVDWQHVLGQIPVWVSPEVPAELEGLSPEEVADIAQAFLSSVPGVLRELREAVGAGRLERAGSLAHRLKGSCAAVGAVRAAELCRHVEEDPAMSAVSELAAELERVFDEMTRLASGQVMINGA